MEAKANGQGGAGRRSAEAVRGRVAISRRRARGRMPSGAANPIDVHVGNRVRLRRTLLGMSQEKLGAALGLTFQQVQKYERGANRIGASRLFDLSRVLDVKIGWFFEDMSPEVAAAGPSVMSQASEDPLLPEPEEGTLARRETLGLIRFLEIMSPDKRQVIEAMINNFAASRP